MTLEELITKCLIGEEHLDQAEYEQVGNLLIELKTLRKAYELICDSYVNDTEECNCPRELRKRCKAQDFMSRHCTLNSIAAVKDYFLEEAQKNDKN